MSFLKNTLFALGFGLFTPAFAGDLIPTIYDPSTNSLQISTLVVGDTKYNGLVIRLDSIKIVSTGISSKVSGPDVPPPCSAFAPAFTDAQMAKVKNGMTLDQVNQALGCQYATFGLMSGTGSPYTYTAEWAAGLGLNSIGFDSNGLVTGR